MRASVQFWFAFDALGGVSLGKPQYVGDLDLLWGRARKKGDRSMKFDEIRIMWVRRCHKPAIWPYGNGNHTTFKNGDDWEISSTETTFQKSKNLKPFRRMVGGLFSSLMFGEFHISGDYSSFNMFDPV